MISFKIKESNNMEKFKQSYKNENETIQQSYKNENEMDVAVSFASFIMIKLAT